MKIINDQVYLTITDIANAVGVTLSTIKDWEKWAKINDSDLVPKANTSLDKKGTRYYIPSDIDKFKKFKAGITYGMLSEVSRNRWGVRKEPKKGKK